MSLITGLAVPYLPLTGRFELTVNPACGLAAEKLAFKVVLGSSRQWRTTILQVVLAAM
ncbi:TPA: hypothetical protein ACT2TS_004748 [Citrobacter braakii]